ncbi:MAG TPA: hypothetical protein VEW46_20550 [Pyrinomonadaceae bacterium]|nr:hypothetical protein [Pyrinomonadaceae bacterium]
MVMVTKDIIKSEIERVPEERLEELYEVVKVYSRSETESNGGTLFSKLMKISIDGPRDFSENLDLYLSGEKTIG